MRRRSKREKLQLILFWTCGIIILMTIIVLSCKIYLVNVELPIFSLLSHELPKTSCKMLNHLNHRRISEISHNSHHTTKEYRWNPFDFDVKFSVYNELFNRIHFNSKQIILNITYFDKYKYCIKYGYLYKFTNYSKIGILIAFIIPAMYNNDIGTVNVKTKGYSNTLFMDSRYKQFKLLNAIQYAYIHKYDLIYITKAVWNPVKQLAAIDPVMYNLLKKPHYQKPFLLKKFLKYYKWLLWMDFDSMFYDCYKQGVKIEDIIDYTYTLHSNDVINPKQTISYIFAGDKTITSNTGILFLKNNEWMNNMINKWIYVIKHFKEYNFSMIEGYRTYDQFIINLLLQGWNINDKNIKHMQKLRNRYQLNHLDIEGYRKDRWRANYEYPLRDKNISQYAVSIDRNMINARSENYNLKNPNDKNIIIVHVAGNHWRRYVFKLFKMIQHAQEHCHVDS